MLAWETLGRWWWHGSKVGFSVQIPVALRITSVYICPKNYTLEVRGISDGRTARTDLSPPYVPEARRPTAPHVPGHPSGPGSPSHLPGLA